VAVRSSGLCEDLYGTSFAGQYHSELNVKPENIIQAYKNVVASKYSMAAMAYRYHRGIPDEDAAVSVGCMRMVDAISGGVAYSRNPANIRDDSIIINAVWGLPKAVVDGTGPSDIYIVSRENPLKISHKNIVKKEMKIVLSQAEGLVRKELNEKESLSPTLSDDQALEIAHLAVTLEKNGGLPQDIEWAIEKDGSVVILQSRPLIQKDISTFGKEEGYESKEAETVILKGGVTASPGVAHGRVFIVNNDVDALQFPDKAVVVARQSLPKWAALLGRAAAIITEQGNIAGHLATVAREFDVPALFGVHGAVETLENDQSITVDADGRRVHRGRIHALVKQTRVSRNLMEGSPVFLALENACRYITPLTLLDPDSAEFRAENCKTFHDITRFCHEKILQEMFQFGRDHRLVDRSGKKLICDLPMTYWAINLDDGFREEAHGDTVHLENIVSIPMLAFWEGLSAAPWKDPAPVRSRGLMSAFMEATMNPALEPSRASHYATRNYCLISKNFCILQLRFNFHFCTVESYLGERNSDNYINFHFKGGAANLQRRAYRARLVSEILEVYDFHTTLKEDAAFAQLKGYDYHFTKERLKVLGYLAMHTRQLDLSMESASSITYHKSRMLADMSKALH
jgi:pyruvate,water dikinase